MWLVYLACGLVVLYLIINGRRNADPLNRKCAAEICEYLVMEREPTALAIAQIFLANARYRKSANHIVSMVPAILIKNGFAKNLAFGTVPLLRQAAMLVPV